MHQVEAYLGNMGNKCNAKLLKKKGINLKSWEHEIRIRGALAAGELPS